METDAVIAPGDIVEIRSGGPKLTVDRIEGDRIHVLWFDDKGQPRRDDFAAHCLRKCESLFG